jgi:purine-binding chemotaxis protein CheW
MSTAVLETPVQEPTTSATHGSVQLVSFRLGQEEFGIEITRVREIILVGEITRLPESPAYIKGLINLRSTVMPVVDLCTRFGLPQSDVSDESRIMVVNVRGKTIGIVVDAVSEVLRVSLDQIVPAPTTVARLDTEYLTGLVRLEKHLLILLDIEKVFSNQMEAIDTAA